MHYVPWNHFSSICFVLAISGAIGSCAHVVTILPSKVCKMEVEGFRRCMEYLLDKGFQIVVLGTYRHVQIRSLMKKQYPEIEHQFDVWHLANSVYKKLFHPFVLSLPFLGLLAHVHMLLPFYLQKCAHLQHDELWS
jgi:hypothetical protein